MARWKQIDMADFKKLPAGTHVKVVEHFKSGGTIATEGELDEVVLEWYRNRPLSCSHLRGMPRDLPSQQHVDLWSHTEVFVEALPIPTTLGSVIKIDDRAAILVEEMDERGLELEQRWIWSDIKGSRWGRERYVLPELVEQAEVLFAAPASE